MLDGKSLRTMNRVLIWLMLALCLSGLPVFAQNDHAYDMAKDRFSSLSWKDRILLQQCLVATGHWNAVPNDNFSKRLYQAITKFQSDYGFVPNGYLSDETITLLTRQASLLFHIWGFQEVQHHQRPRKLWVPMGLALSRQISEPYELNLAGPAELGDVSVRYSYHSGTVKGAYEAFLSTFKGTSVVIHYSTQKSDFFVVSFSFPGGRDGYLRFHRDGSGVIGFIILWNNRLLNVFGERIAILMSGAFR
ncbi:MAG: peptidoglycan-binding protein, partial [Methylobacteriaceae bacterium]|nr:peptidoglycan-binding protein [Methylobacteriaceae bacterium]